jgi:hypothetical protein
VGAAAPKQDMNVLRLSELLSLRWRLFAAIPLVASLATVACAPRVKWINPVTLTDYPAGTYTNSNMLIVGNTRMALPEGWFFRRRDESDPKQVKFWIHNAGGKVIGAYRFEHVDFSISGPRVAERLVEIVMKDFSDIKIQRTNVDNAETYIINGLKNGGMQRITGLILDNNVRNGTALSEITFVEEKAYFDQDPRVFYTVLNTFKTTPYSLSERRLKGSFSFKSDDGSFEWITDERGRGQQKGFTVAGPMGNGVLFITIQQVATAHFSDLYKMERFDPKEIETVLHFAGSSYSARAIHRVVSKEEKASTVFWFKHKNNNYMLSLYRSKTPAGTLDPAIHEIPEVRTVLETKFYFDN